MRPRTIRIFIVLFVLSGILTTQAQNKELVAETMATFPKTFQTTAPLAARINTSFDNDLDKVYAVYWWITHNIKYSYKALPKYDVIGRRAIRQDRENYKTLAAKGIADFTISNKYAVCEGYSVLFADLCEQLGIDCRKVSGFGKVSPEDIGRSIKDTNHAWNVVTLNGESFLVDSTWGAGYSNGGWVPSPRDFYFKTPPSQFFLKHYPVNKADALLEQTPSIESFINAPVFYEWRNVMVEMQSPDSGIIEKPRMSYKEIYFELKVGDKTPEQILIGDPDNVSLVDDFTQEDGLVKFNYRISSHYPIDTLWLFFDGESVLTFSVK